MKKIPLTQGHFALVDDEDYAALSQHKWCIHKNRNVFYARRSLSGTTTMMHREILGFQKDDGKSVDHIDHDGLNNQKSNLRICTIQQNGMNRRKQKNTSSKYKGVYWSKSDKKWRAQIMFDNRSIFLGLFDSEIEAAQAYDEKAKELFGAFAKINKEEGKCNYRQAK